MSASIAIRMLVTTLRENDEAIQRGFGRADDDMICASGGVSDGVCGFFRAGRLSFERDRAGRHDHAAGAVKRPVLQFEPEQPLAFEGAGQREFGGLLRREAEPRIIRLIAKQDDRAMAAFDQRQAQERAFFNANELQHRNQVIQQLAMGVRPMPHDRDGRRA